MSQAMRLFGEQGYAATSVTQVEQAAGLSPGAGGLYRHFQSKQDLLTAGVRQQIAGARDLLALLAGQENLADLPLRDRLVFVAHAGLRRLEEEQDFTRVLLRDLGRFPDLLALARDEEIGRLNTVLAQWLSSQGEAGARRDWDAIAVVLVCAVTHFWLLGDIFGEDPNGVGVDRFIDALTQMAVALITTEERRPDSNVATTR